MRANLKAARLRNRYTQKEFAEIVHVGYRTYQDYERGGQGIDYYIAQRIADALNEPVQKLMEDTDPSPKEKVPPIQMLPKW